MAAAPLPGSTCAPTLTPRLVRVCVCVCVCACVCVCVRVCLSRCDRVMDSALTTDELVAIQRSEAASSGEDTPPFGDDDFNVADQLAREAGGSSSSSTQRPCDRVQ